MVFLLGGPPAFLPAAMKNVVLQARSTSAETGLVDSGVMMSPNAALPSRVAGGALRVLCVLREPCLASPHRLEGIFQAWLLCQQDCIAGIPELLTGWGC